MFETLPIFGVCGHSGSGKTTVLEQIVPRFVQRGLRVAVVKHDVHGITSDPVGKDSDRLFHAGADVVLHGPREVLGRYAQREDLDLQHEFGRLAEQHDLVLLEGFKTLPCRKVWLFKAGDATPPAAIGEVDAALPWDADRAAILEALVTRFLEEVVRATPVFGCVLIGGGATRMGRPKHLLSRAGTPQQTWLHHAVAVLQRNCRQVVICGDGALPHDLQGLPRLADPPNVGGPLAGLLAAVRWEPKASWLLAACDMPCLSDEAVQWILDQRAPSVWAVLPRINRSPHLETLLAWYDFRCRTALEAIARSEPCRLRDIARHPQVRTVTIPAELAEAWTDADTPEAAAPFTENSANG